VVKTLNICPRVRAP